MHQGLTNCIGMGLSKMMVNYMPDVAEEMSWKSDKIRRDFAQHRLSAGENRQDLVGQFLVDHLPKRFGVDTGFVISRDGGILNQADLVVVDKENNARLYGDYRNKLWPVESVYALVEVKTRLNPDDLDDFISKGRSSFACHPDVSRTELHSISWREGTSLRSVGRGRRLPSVCPGDYSRIGLSPNPPKDDFGDSP